MAQSRQLHGDGLTSRVDFRRDTRQRAAMSVKQEIIRQLLEPGVVAIIRTNSSEQLIEAAEALFEGGIRALEVTMTTPNALAAISEISGRFGETLLVGVGTVLDPATARAAILAGAQFVVTPVSKPE